VRLKTKEKKMCYILRPRRPLSRRAINDETITCEQKLSKGKIHAFVYKKNCSAKILKVKSGAVRWRVKFVNEFTKMTSCISNRSPVLSSSFDGLRVKS